MTARQAVYVRMWIFLAALMALAVGLRLFHLTMPSLWADEGNSVRVTERALHLVIDAARADIHPPAYYVLLWGWAKLFGQSEAAMRGFSALVGVLLVGAIYALAQRLFGRRTGWLAAFCAAVSPFQIAHSQQARMYILVALEAVVATWALVGWLEATQPRQRIRWAVVYGLAAAAGLWTHYSFPIVIVSLNIAWLVWWVRQVRSSAGPLRHRPAMAWLIEWGVTQLAVVALYAPWLPTAWAKTVGYGAISESYSPAFIISQALQLLSIGETAPADEWTNWLTVGMTGLALFGVWEGWAQPRRRETRIHMLTLILSILAPVVMMATLALIGRPAYRPKFFLVASPAFCVLVGRGIAVLEQTTDGRRTWGSRIWLLVGLGLVAIAAGRSLQQHYFSPVQPRGDYRGIATAISQIERRGDAILLNAPNQWEVFTYYYPENPNRAPIYPLCRARPPVEAEVVAELEQIAARHQRLFVLYWAAEQSDPTGIVERWLDAHTFKAADTWYGDVRLAIYATPLSEPVKMIHPLTDVRLGEAIALRGYTVAPNEPQRGDVVQVALFWEAMGIPTARYKVFIHLVGADGQIMAQFDGEPRGEAGPTVQWRPENGVMVERYGVLLPQTAASGEYRLVTGMYDVSGAPRLPVYVDGQPAGDFFTLATLSVH